MMFIRSVSPDHKDQTTRQYRASISSNRVFHSKIAFQFRQNMNSSHGTNMMRGLFTPQLQRKITLLAQGKWIYMDNQLTWGEPASWCRRSNRPGNSQAKGPTSKSTLWREARNIVPAEGIAISGNRTEGASCAKAVAFVIKWCRMISRYQTGY